MMRAATVLAIVLGATGCATDYSKKHHSEVAQLVTTVDSEFDTSRVFAGPQIRGGEGLFEPRYTAQLVTSQSKKTGDVMQVLLVTWSYVGSSWLYFDSVSLPGGYQPPTRIVNREVRSCSGGSCSYEETLSTIIPLDAIAKATGGLRVRYNSQRGGAFVEFPVNYLVGYLEGVAAKVTVK